MMLIKHLVAYCLRLKCNLSTAQIDNRETFEANYSVHSPCLGPTWPLPQVRSRLHASSTPSAHLGKSDVG